MRNKDNNMDAIKYDAEVAIAAPVIPQIGIKK